VGQGERVCVVSGCTSIEEFVAAFRKHAQRDDLFVPTRTPLAVGSRGRLAVTLRDGSVVLEGQVTVVSTAQDKKRKGMTLRFSVLDAESRALLDHLDRERFRAKPTRLPGTLRARPGPEVGDAPAPRPQRTTGVDGASALAECVVVGRLPSPDDAEPARPRAPLETQRPPEVEVVAPSGDPSSTDTVQMWMRIPKIPRPIASALPTERMSAGAIVGEPPAVPVAPAYAPALAPRPTTPAPAPPAKIATGSRPLGSRGEAAAAEAERAAHAPQRSERYLAAGPTARVSRSTDPDEVRPLWVPIALLAAAVALAVLVARLAF
jgi:hypothetical protein